MFAGATHCERLGLNMSRSVSWSCLPVVGEWQCLQWNISGLLIVWLIWDVGLQHKITLYMLVVTIINDNSRL